MLMHFYKEIMLMIKKSNKTCTDKDNFVKLPKIKITESYFDELFNAEDDLFGKIIIVCSDKVKVITNEDNFWEELKEATEGERYVAGIIDTTDFQEQLLKG